MKHIRDALLKYREAWEGNIIGHRNPTSMALWSLYSVVGKHRGGLFFVERKKIDAVKSDAELTAKTFLNYVSSKDTRTEIKQLFETEGFKRKLLADVQLLKNAAEEKRIEARAKIIHDRKNA